MEFLQSLKATGYFRTSYTAAAFHDAIAAERLDEVTRQEQEFKSRHDVLETIKSGLSKMDQPYQQTYSNLKNWNRSLNDIGSLQVYSGRIVLHAGFFVSDMNDEKMKAFEDTLDAVEKYLASGSCMNDANLALHLQRLRATATSEGPQYGDLALT